MNDDKKSDNSKTSTDTSEEGERAREVTQRDIQRLGQQRRAREWSERSEKGKK